MSLVPGTLVRCPCLVLGPQSSPLVLCPEAGPRTKYLDQGLRTEDGPRTKGQGPRTTKRS
jgi:hypothetical protein